MKNVFSELAASAILCTVPFLTFADIVSGDKTITENTRISGLANPGKTITVESAQVTIAPSGGEAALAEDLREGLTLWLDANRNVIEGETKIAAYKGSETNTLSGVVEWRDVRESGSTRGSFVYPRALVNRPDLYLFGDFASRPASFYENQESIPGLKMVDFGGFGSGKWMYVADAWDNLYRLRVRTFFMVVAFNETMGHLLSHIPGLQSYTNNAQMFFHKNAGANGTTLLGKESNINSQWQYGETRIDGRLVNPNSTYLSNDATVEVISQVGPAFADIGNGLQVPYFNSFLNYGNLTSARGYTARQGGGMFGEVLIYDRILTEGERRRVEAYLTAKWKGKAVGGTVDVDSASKVVLEGDLTLENIQGEGEVVFDGNELRQRANLSADSAAVEIRSGTVRQEEKIAPLRLKAVGGKRVSLAADSCTVSDIADSGRFEIVGASGNESVIVEPGSAETTVAVTGARLIASSKKTLASAAPKSWENKNLLRDGDAESLKTKNAYDEIAAGSSAWEVEGCVYSAKYTSNVWYGYMSSRNKEGEMHFAIQGKKTSDGGAIGVMSQRFTAPVTGLYKLSYLMSRRVSRSEADGETALKVMLDGKTIFLNPFEKIDGVWDNELKKFEHVLPPLEKDSEHTLTLTLGSGDNDRAAVLDDIRLVAIEERDDVIHVPNGGFEGASFIPTGNLANGRFKEFAQLREVLWTTNGVGGCGLTRNSTWWSYCDGNASETAQDRHKLYLQREAAASTVVKLPRRGRIVFSMRYSNRRRQDLPASYADNVCGNKMRPSGHHLEVTLAGSLIASIPVDPGDRMLKWESSFDYEGETGEVALTIANKLPSVLPDGTDDMAAIVDDVELRYEGAYDSVARGEQLELTLDVPSDGFYRLRLPMGLESVVIADAAAGKRWSACSPAKAILQIGSLQVGGVKCESSQRNVYEYDLPYLAAGSHVLKVVSQASSTAADAVLRVYPFELVGLEETADGLRDFGSTTVRIGSGAKLDLRFSGSESVGKIARALEVRGTQVDAGLYPLWVEGPGAFTFKRPGFLLFLR
jgi:hypothetical protein